MLKSGFKSLFLLLLATALISCGENKKQPKSEDEFLNAAKTLYDSAAAKKDKELFTQSINTYKDFIKTYPKSEKVLTAYNQIAGIYFDNLQNYQEAIGTYREIVDKFPDKREAKQSLFMVAFIYDETLKDKENAMASYKKFLEKYPQDTDPNDKMSESAKRMLEVLETGQSIEDIILKSIEKQGDTKETPKETPKQTAKDKNIDQKPPKDQRKTNKTDDATTDAPVKK